MTANTRSDFTKFLFETHVCLKCGWTGTGATMTIENLAPAGEDRHCPKCGAFHTHIVWPGGRRPGRPSNPR